MIIILVFFFLFLLFHDDVVLNDFPIFVSLNVPIYKICTIYYFCYCSYSGASSWVEYPFRNPGPLCFCRRKFFCILIPLLFSNAVSFVSIIFFWFFGPNYRWQHPPQLLQALMPWHHVNRGVSVQFSDK